MLPVADVRVGVAPTHRGVGVHMPQTQHMPRLVAQSTITH
jgi:hypothetical protein